MNRNHSRGRSAASEQRGNTLLGIAVGVVIGILASLIVVWLMNRNPAPFVNKAQQPPAAGQAVEPQPLPAKPGDQPQEKRFQFYEILPGKTAPQPSPAKPADPRKPAAAAVEQQALAHRVGGRVGDPGTRLGGVVWGCGFAHRDSIVPLR